MSAKLGLISLLFAEAVGLFFGILCAQFRGKWPDYLLMVVAVLGIALPSMVLGPILRMIFGVKLGILPVTGWGKPNQIILPALVLGLGTVAGNTRNMRASMLAITTQDYVKTARAKGLFANSRRIKASSLKTLTLFQSFPNLGVQIAGVLMAHLS